MITAAMGCSRWSKESGEWSVSSGVATPLVVEAVPSGASAPFLVEDDAPSTQLKTEKTVSKRKQTLASGAQTQCSKGGDRRTLAVVRHGAGCRLSYQTSSHVENVAEAVWGKRVCQQVRTQIVQKLKSAGYSCS